MSRRQISRFHDFLSAPNLCRPHLFSNLTGGVLARRPPANSERGSDMRSQRMVWHIAIAMAAGLAADGPASADENRGTPEQQMACTPDALRLCGQWIPDVGRITECLRQNTPQLSAPCRAVFEVTSASMPPRPALRSRGGGPRPAYDRTRSDDDDQ